MGFWMLANFKEKNRFEWEMLKEMNRLLDKL